MKKQFSWIFILLSLGFVLFSLFSTSYEIRKKGKLLPTRYFELVHNFPTDYNFYLSRIRQGIEGRVTALEKYTSEPHTGSFIHVLYLGLGWAGRTAGIPPAQSANIYHVGRIVLGFTLLMLMARYAKQTFRTTVWQVIAFLLVVTASTWPKLETVEGVWRFGGYMPWWSVMDSLQRITFIPHILFGQSLIILILLALTHERVMVKTGNWIVLGIVGFILGIVFPPGLLFVYTALFITIAVEYVFLGKQLTKAQKRDWFMKKLASSGIFFLLSFPALVYLQLMVTFYPWKRLSEVDIIRPLPFDYLEYIKALGPVLLFGMFGLILGIWKKEKHLILSVSWVIAWVLLLVVFRFIPAQSPLRFSEMIPHLPLGILTAYFFYSLSRGVSRGSISLVIYHLSFMALTVLITVGLGVMYSSWLWQKDFVDHKMRATYPLVPTGAYVMYPLKDFVAAMKYLEENTPRSVVVLSETTAGNYIPVYSGNTVYIGHDNTVQLEQKKETVAQFYRGQMSQERGYGFLHENNVQYVFFGPQEFEDGGLNKLEQHYPYLTSVYQNPSVTLYKVQ